MEVSNLYQYRVVERFDPSREEQEQLVNYYARYGWELVQVVHSPNRSLYYFYFKGYVKDNK